jgi:Type III secretion system lipoprotein chaperone (YscW)
MTIRKSNPANRYALQAEITVDERLWFATTTYHPILTATGLQDTDIIVQHKSALHALRQPGIDAITCTSAAEYDCREKHPNHKGFFARTSLAANR